ncbi:hypothetical protein JOB18_001337 [Solea senegalensis]|uniref:Uncharacterized protein n=1 Tax=Solea senegalensis TaxID=28829 RepID=A0AAV6S3W9_SOLSE|nr:hypothetical protein JOB18_001337 [Solea senegalensis]
MALINPTPTTEFDQKQPSLKEVEEVIEVSIQGPSGLVYKHCPELLQHLWNILKLLTSGGGPAEGVWIPKEENSKNIDQFWTISLLSVKGKVFYSIVSRRLTDFLLRNSYIDPSVQKGGIPGAPSCLEHIGS